MVEIKLQEEQVVETPQPQEEEQKSVEEQVEEETIEQPQEGGEE